jgi:hypothetical protein
LKKELSEFNEDFQPKRYEEEIELPEGRYILLIPSDYAWEHSESGGAPGSPSPFCAGLKSLSGRPCEKRGFEKKLDIPQCGSYLYSQEFIDFKHYYTSKAFSFSML